MKTTVNRKKLMKFKQKIKITRDIIIWISSKMSGFEEKFMTNNMKKAKTGAVERTLASNQNLNENMSRPQNIDEN